MAYRVKAAKRVLKYLKKENNRQLKKKFADIIYDDLAKDPYIGEEKHGDLRGYYTVGFNYQRTAYRIAYTINDDGEIVIVVLVGSHEKFYEQLKRIIKG